MNTSDTPSPTAIKTIEPEAEAQAPPSPDAGAAGRRGRRARGGARRRTRQPTRR